MFRTVYIQYEGANYLNVSLMLQVHYGQSNDIFVNPSEKTETSDAKKKSSQVEGSLVQQPYYPFPKEGNDQAYLWRYVVLSGTMYLILHLFLNCYIISFRTSNISIISNLSLLLVTKCTSV